MKAKQNFIYLFFLFIPLLISCGNHNAKNTDYGAEPKIFLTESTDIAIPNNETFNRISAKNGNIIYSTTSSDTSDEQFYCFDNTETVTEPFYSVDVSKDYVLDFQAVEKGLSYFLVLVTEGMKEDIYLRKLYFAAEESTYKKEDIIWMNDFHGGENDDCYNWNIEISPEGNILIFSALGYRYLSPEGVVLKEERWQEAEAYDFCFLTDGSGALRLYINDEMKLFKIDKDTGEKLALEDAPTSSAFEFLGSPDNGFLVRTDALLYDYNDQNQQNVRWRWSDYGIVTDDIRQLYYNETGELSCILLHENALSAVSWKVGHMAKPKTEIRLGCMNERSQVRNAVAKFNSANSEYVITVVDYWQNGEETADHLNALYNDILAGKGPDIIELDNEYIDYSLLERKGILEDLVPYLEKSDIIKEKDFVSPVYKSFLKNEKLYYLPTNFVVSTMVTKEKWAADHSSWTIDRMIKILQDNPDLGESLTVSKTGILRYCLDYCLDLKEGEKESLDIGLIKKYIELANLAPTEAIYNGEYAPRKEGKVLFDDCNFMEVNDYLFQKSVWGEDASFVGYPEAAGNGVIIAPVNNWGINAKSTNKDAAWKFIESYFTDGWQAEIAPNWNFSTLTTTFESQLTDSMQYETYVDENGDTKEFPEQSYLSDDGTQYIDVYAAREEDIQAIKNMIQDAQTVKLNKNSLSNIIIEEASYYFAGEKSIDEVIDIIENRGQLLLSE